MPVGFRHLDPRPRFSGPRLAAGAFAGGVGGLAFALLMAGQLIRGPLVPQAMAGMLSRLLGTDLDILIWGVHLLIAAVFGLVFSAFVAPHRARRVLPVALGYGVLLWALGAFLALRLLTGTPLRLDGPALYDLAGHVLFGAVMGAVYLAFFRAEDDAAQDRATTLSRTPPVRRA